MTLFDRIASERERLNQLKYGARYRVPFDENSWQEFVEKGALIGSWNRSATSCSFKFSSNGEQTS